MTFRLLPGDETKIKKPFPTRPRGDVVDTNQTRARLLVSKARGLILAKFGGQITAPAMQGGSCHARAMKSYATYDLEGVKMHETLTLCEEPESQAGHSESLGLWSTLKKRI
jgi:hypothetical protein